MTTVEILIGGATTFVEDVATWWYDGTTLWVEFADGSRQDYPGGNVVGRQ